MTRAVFRVGLILCCAMTLISAYAKPPSADQTKKDLIDRTLTFLFDAQTDKQWTVAEGQIKHFEINQRMKKKALNRDELFVTVTLENDAAQFTAQLKMVYQLGGGGWALSGVEVMPNTVRYSALGAAAPTPQDAGALGPLAAAANAALQMRARDLRETELQYFQMNGRYACRMEDLLGLNKHLAGDPDFTFEFGPCNEGEFSITVRSVKTKQEVQVSEGASGGSAHP
jgi:hypothetical protein